MVAVEALKSVHSTLPVCFLGVGAVTALQWSSPPHRAFCARVGTLGCPPWSDRPGCAVLLPRGPGVMATVAALPRRLPIPLPRCCSGRITGLLGLPLRGAVDADSSRHATPPPVVVATRCCCSHNRAPWPPTPRVAPTTRCDTTAAITPPSRSRLPLHHAAPLVSLGAVRAGPDHRRHAIYGTAARGPR